MAGTFYSLSANNGKAHYRWETGGAITNPVLLEGRTVYVISYSNTLFDAYFLGKPVVLYTQYDPKLLKLLDGKSEGGEACDFFIHREPEKLDDVLKHLILGKVNVYHDASFIKENFPDTPHEFWDFWQKVL